MIMSHNSQTEVDRNVCDGDLISSCFLEKPPNQAMLLTALRAAADVRPAWASTWRCKSSRNLAAGTEANRKGPSVSEGLEEAGSELAGRRTGSRYEATSARASEQIVAKLLWPRAGVVDRTVVRGRPMFLPGETSPHA